MGAAVVTRTRWSPDIRRDAQVNPYVGWYRSFENFFSTFAGASHNRNISRNLRGNADSPCRIVDLQVASRAVVGARDRRWRPISGKKSTELALRVENSSLVRMRPPAGGGGCFFSTPSRPGCRARSKYWSKFAGCLGSFVERNLSKLESKLLYQPTRGPPGAARGDQATDSVSRAPSCRICLVPRPSFVRLEQ